MSTANRMNTTRVRNFGLSDNRAVHAEPVRGIKRTLYTIVAVVLCVSYMLFPIERGFPTFQIAGFPVTITIIVSILAFVGLITLDPQILEEKLITRYVALQLVVVFTFIIATFRAEDFFGSIFVVLNYFVTFILNFLIVYYLFLKSFRSSFMIIVTVVAVVATLVGLAEFLFRSYLPIYQGIYLSYIYGHDVSRMSYAMSLANYRVVGSLGNPIIYSVLLGLAAPFVNELRHPIKYVIIGLMFVISVLTFARTGIVLWAIIALGMIASSKNKTRVIAMTIAITIMILLLGLLFPRLMDSLLSYVYAFITRDETNISSRFDLFAWALDNFQTESSLLSTFFGQGLKYTVDIASFGVRTLDNTYTTLLLETGLIGMLAYLALMGTTLNDFRQGTQASLYWYSVLGMVIANLTFVPIYYSTFNFVWVASIAVLAFDKQAGERARFVDITAENVTPTGRAR